MNIEPINHSLFVIRLTDYILVNKVALISKFFHLHFLLQWPSQQKTHQQSMQLVPSQVTIQINRIVNLQPNQSSHHDLPHYHTTQLSRISQNWNNFWKHNLHYPHLIVRPLSHKWTHQVHCCSSSHHIPIPIPHHWKQQNKASLDADVKNRIISKVPIGTPSTWCSQMIVVPKKDGSPYCTVDLQHLNSQCLGGNLSLPVCVSTCQSNSS